MSVVCCKNLFSVPSDSRLWHYVCLLYSIHVLFTSVFIVSETQSALPPRLSLDDFPNPANSEQEQHLCNRNHPSFICDPNHILSPTAAAAADDDAGTQLDLIDNLILQAKDSNLIFCPRSLKQQQAQKEAQAPMDHKNNHDHLSQSSPHSHSHSHSQRFDASLQSPQSPQSPQSLQPQTEDAFSRSHFHGLQIGVAVISSLTAFESRGWRSSPSLSMDRDTVKYMTERYAKSIHDQWAVGEQQCNNGITVLIAIDDHYLFVSTGSSVKLVITKPFIDDFLIPVKVRPLMREQRYTDAIELMVRAFIDIAANSDDLTQAGSCAIHTEYLEYTSSWSYYVQNELPTDEIIIVVVVVVLIAAVAYSMRKQVAYRECHRQLAELHAHQQAGRFDQSSCPICLENFNRDGEQTTTSILICGHKFCTACLDSWFNQQPQSNQKCPICRQDRNDWSAALKQNANEHNNGQALNDHNEDASTNNNNNNINSAEAEPLNPLAHASAPPMEDREDDDAHANHNHSNNHGGSSNLYRKSMSMSAENGMNSGSGGGGGVGGSSSHNGRHAQSSSMRYRRRSAMDNWLFRNELLFRMHRLRYMYPSYIDNTMVNRWSRPGYTQRYTTDSAFRVRNPTTSFRRAFRDGVSGGSSRSSGFSFGGGSSRGGGGGGGGW